MSQVVEHDGPYYMPLKDVVAFMTTKEKEGWVMCGLAQGLGGTDYVVYVCRPVPTKANSGHTMIPKWYRRLFPE